MAYSTSSQVYVLGGFTEAEVSGPNVETLIDFADAEIDSLFNRSFDNETAFTEYISLYLPKRADDLEPNRIRKLLLHKKEIKRLLGLQQLKNQTIIPLGLYLKKGWVKMSIGIAKGKKQHDKRDTIKKKDLAREMGRQFKGKIKL